MGAFRKADPSKSVKKENETLKRITGDLNIANDALKKPWRKTEIERGQDYPWGDEPSQDAAICGSYKVHVVPYTKAPKNRDKSRHGRRSQANKHQAAHLWNAPHGRAVVTRADDARKPQASTTDITLGYGET